MLTVISRNKKIMDTLKKIYSDSRGSPLLKIFIGNEVRLSIDYPMDVESKLKKFLDENGTVGKTALIRKARENYIKTYKWHPKDFEVTFKE